jgi:hypothetical protein
LSRTVWLSACSRPLIGSSMTMPCARLPVTPAMMPQAMYSLPLVRLNSSAARLPGVMVACRIDEHSAESRS